MADNTYRDCKDCTGEHCKKCYGVMGGHSTQFVQRKLTNREWMQSLSNEDFAFYLWHNWFFDEIHEKDFLTWLSAEHTE